MLCDSSSGQHCHLCRGSSKSDFPQVGVRKRVCAVLVHRSNEWPRSAALSWLAMATPGCHVPRKAEAEGLGMAVLVDAAV